jgi:hypothetical protein
MKSLTLALFAGSFLVGHAPYAQGGYTVTTPGQSPTFIKPNPIGGGYTIYTPGQIPSFVSPNPIGGGYTVITPGQPTIFINPNPLYGR